MTPTRVVTARMIPSKVKKLRSLWARRASRANLKVSPTVTAALRNLDKLNGTLADCGMTRPMLPNRSIGATPKQTSACILHNLIRGRGSIRSRYIDVCKGCSLSLNLGNFAFRLILKDLGGGR